jgi:hypothetical protein
MRACLKTVLNVVQSVAALQLFEFQAERTYAVFKGSSRTRDWEWKLRTRHSYKLRVGSRCTIVLRNARQFDVKGGRENPWLL